MSRRTCERSLRRSIGGTRTRVTSSAPSATQTAQVKNGVAIATANSAAPTAGPMSWLVVRKPAIIRALPTVRSSLATTIGSSVWLAVFAEHLGDADQQHRHEDHHDADRAGHDRHGQHAPRPPPARGRRPPPAAGGPGGRPARPPTARTAAREAAAAARRAPPAAGPRVCDAISSGPAASPIPSPRLLIHVEVTEPAERAPHPGGQSKLEQAGARRQPTVAAGPRAPACRRRMAAAASRRSVGVVRGRVGCRGGAVGFDEVEDGVRGGREGLVAAFGDLWLHPRAWLRLSCSGVGRLTAAFGVQVEGRRRGSRGGRAAVWRVAGSARGRRNRSAAGRQPRGG